MEDWEDILSTMKWPSVLEAGGGFTMPTSGTVMRLQGSGQGVSALTANGPGGHSTESSAHGYLKDNGVSVLKLRRARRDVSTSPERNCNQQRDQRHRHRKKYKHTRPRSASHSGVISVRHLNVLSTRTHRSRTRDINRDSPRRQSLAYGNLTSRQFTV